MIKKFAVWHRMLYSCTHYGNSEHQRVSNSNNNINNN